MPTRINKLLSERGFCSRREADRLVTDGRVTIDGRKAVAGDKADEGADIRVNGEPVLGGDAATYIVLNKPVGYITTMDQTKKDNVLKLVDVPQRIFPVGRLDVESEGLLLLTNDGELANRLTHPRYGHEKEYFINVDKPLQRDHVRQLEEGVMLEDGIAKAHRARTRSAQSVSMVLREGRNRQVRRMLAALGYTVRLLRRTRLASLTLDGLRVGEWRRLTAKEIDSLRKLTGLTQKRKNDA